jgi:two-component system chemotaxis response regulator CheY
MSSLSPLNFLVVDDYENIRIMLKSNLKDLQLSRNYFEANDGKAALEILEKQASTDEPIEFVICDLLMPTVSGLDLLKTMRQDPRFSEIPFIMLSSQNEKDVVLECIQEGISTYILKPWTKAQLVEKISKALKKHQK